MEKRWAASLLFVERKGWFQQVVVTLDKNNATYSITPLLKEAARIKWFHSGVLFLVSKDFVFSDFFSGRGYIGNSSIFVNQKLDLLKKIVIYTTQLYHLYYLFPFNIIERKPVCETRHRLLH